MKRITFLLMLIVSFFGMGCMSFHRGAIQSTNVQFNNPNFRYIKTIEGSSSVTYVLGFGGSKTSGLIMQAKNRMYEGYTFDENQTITNVTLDERQTWIFFPVVCKRMVFISADVYQLGNAAESRNTSNRFVDTLNRVHNSDTINSYVLTEDEKYIQKLYNAKSLKVTEYATQENVVVGDFVQFEGLNGEVIFAKVTGKISNNKVRIEMFPTPGTTIFEEINYKKLMKVEF
ncbi:MAG: hypothetical protein GC181_09240 [Bacteroidetes bacterium]|nr:hypothetical protein [Bacteroidota bacterium]